MSQPIVQRDAATSSQAEPHHRPGLAGGRDSDIACNALNAELLATYGFPRRPDGHSAPFYSLYIERHRVWGMPRRWAEAGAPASAETANHPQASVAVPGAASPALRASTSTASCGTPGCDSITNIIIELTGGPMHEDALEAAMNDHAGAGNQVVHLAARVLQFVPTRGGGWIGPDVRDAVMDLLLSAASEAQLATTGGQLRDLVVVAEAAVAAEDRATPHQIERLMTAAGHVLAWASVLDPGQSRAGTPPADQARGFLEALEEVGTADPQSAHSATPAAGTVSTETASRARDQFQDIAAMLGRSLRSTDQADRAALAVMCSPDYRDGVEEAGAVVSDTLLRRDPIAAGLAHGLSAELEVLLVRAERTGLVPEAVEESAPVEKTGADQSSTSSLPVGGDRTDLGHAPHLFQPVTSSALTSRGPAVRRSIAGAAVEGRQSPGI